MRREQPQHDAAIHVAAILERCAGTHDRHGLRLHDRGGGPEGAETGAWCLGLVEYHYCGVLVIVSARSREARTRPQQTLRASFLTD
jgi:hypothetical protein